MTESAHSEVYSCQVTSLLQLYKDNAPKQMFQSQLFKTKFYIAFYKSLHRQHYI